MMRYFLSLKITDILLFLILLALIGGGALVGNFLLIVAGIVLAIALFAWARRVSHRRATIAEITEARTVYNREMAKLSWPPLALSWGQHPRMRMFASTRYWLRDGGSGREFTHLSIDELADKAERAMNEHTRRAGDRLLLQQSRARDAIHSPVHDD